MALLPDPTTAASERLSVKNRVQKTRVRHKNRHKHASQGVQGQRCPQHESTQPGVVTLLPHNTRVVGVRWGRERSGTQHPGGRSRAARVV